MRFRRINTLSSNKYSTNLGNENYKRFKVRFHKCQKNFPPLLQADLTEEDLAEVFTRATVSEIRKHLTTLIIFVIDIEETLVLHENYYKGFGTIAFK